MLSRAASKIYTLWLKAAYPFPAFGRGVWLHHTCDVGRSAARAIWIGDGVRLDRDVWLNIPEETDTGAPKIIMGPGCKIGRRSTISGKNKIVLGRDVLTGPSVFISDHGHEFSDIESAIHQQGVTDGGRVTIEQNCWLGTGAVIVCNRGELILGRNSVVAANSVVTRSFPAYSVIAGNPARLIKSFDHYKGEWVRVS